MNNLPALFNPALPPKSPLEIRYAICLLEERMRHALASGGLQEIEFPTLHRFETADPSSGRPARCLRSIFLPAGSILVGKIHRHAHPNAILQGCVTVYTEVGGLETLTAPCKMISPVATKRAIYVHTDTIWTVEHETTATTVAELEAEVIAPSYTALGLSDPVPAILSQLEQQTKQQGLALQES